MGSQGGVKGVTLAVYDCRKEGREVGALSFPCAVQILDPATGIRITNVFYLSTSPAKIGRFLTGPNGEPLARATGRKIKGEKKHAEAIDWAESKMPSKLIIPPKVKEYERLESYEWRPWVAIAINGGGVVARSEGV